MAKEKNIAKQEFLGKGSVLAISANDTYNLIKEEISKDISFLLKGTCQVY